MKAVVGWLTRVGRVPILALAAVVVGASGVAALMARSTTTGQDSPPVSPLALVVVGLLAVLVVITLARLAVMLAGVDPEADRIAQGLATGPAQRRLLARWLQRTRWARNVGGVAGLAWWLLGTSAQGDLLLYGVGGLAIGSIAAQLHQVGRVRGPRTASLERRSLDGYLQPGRRWRMIAVAAGGALLALAGLATGSAAATRFGAVAVAVVAVAHLAQRRVAGRPRAALPPLLQDADDLARALAIDRGLAQPATYFGLVLIAHGAIGLEPTIGAAATAISLAAWIYALYAWWQNRRLGLDWVMAPAPATAAS